MKLEDSINLMVMETVSKTDRLHQRMRDVLVILNVIHAPLTSSPDSKVSTDEGEYDFDDLLVLIFELVQLMATFLRFNKAQQSLNDFLSFHSSRLTALCLEGRLNYTNEVIEFKNIVHEGGQV